MSSRRFARSALGAFTAAAALAGSALADGDALPEPLMELLEAANAQGSADFTRAVQLIALTRPADEVVLGAEVLGQGNAARRALGLEPVILPEEAARAASVELAEDDTTEGKDDGLDNDMADGAGLTGTMTAMPMSVARTIAAGRFELWDGRASLGIRFDSGNTAREDYTFGLQVERELSGWGFQGNIDYAYSEVNGTIGRDNFRTRLRGEREAGERFTYFAAADYERDRVASFDWTAFTGIGAGYRVLIDPARTWIVRAGPGIRMLAEPGHGTQTVAALDLGSDIALQLTESISFTSETSLLVSDTSRFDQIFGLNSALNDLWSLRVQYSYRHEFEPNPGFVSGDSRTDISIAREF
ncbi:MAG: putative salt-induced outer membrane protein [Oceanicaulis sp. HLUCCA04]|nr:MAG: putative salt-induced outer membrane protein [Oceanicaulis sp. HLUCCA04]